jgi:hypothetical protein
MYCLFLKWNFQIHLNFRLVAERDVSVLNAGLLWWRTAGQWVRMSDRLSRSFTSVYKNSTPNSHAMCDNIRVITLLQDSLQCGHSAHNLNEERREVTSSHHDSKCSVTPFTVQQYCTLFEYIFNIGPREKGAHGIVVG